MLLNQNESNVPLRQTSKNLTKSDPSKGIDITKLMVSVNKNQIHPQDQLRSKKSFSEEHAIDLSSPQPESKNLNILNQTDSGDQLFFRSKSTVYQAERVKSHKSSGGPERNSS